MGESRCLEVHPQPSCCATTEKPSPEKFAFHDHLLVNVRVTDFVRPSGIEVPKEFPRDKFAVCAAPITTRFSHESFNSPRIGIDSPGQVDAMDLKLTLMRTF